MKEIAVIFQDGMMDAVPAEALQELIDSDDIVKFQRTDGWVYPGIDPVRKHSHSSYRGPERRQARVPTSKLS